MKLIEGQNFAEVYEKAMKLLLDSPDYETAPRGMAIRECLDVGLQIEDPSEQLFGYGDKKLTLPTGYVKKEMALYLRATDEASEFCKASKFWDSIKTEDGKINSAYGNLVFNPALADGRSQFDWAFESLVADRDSRQAFMRYNGTQHQYAGNRDLPCTFVQTFHIRDGKLHSLVHMRSNDVIKGTTYDIPSFILFQRLMLLRLREVYPDLEMGRYTHFDSSLHLYQQDFELVQQRLQAKIFPKSYPFPENWRCVKSEDVFRCFESKTSQVWLDFPWQYPENADFYRWLSA